MWKGPCSHMYVTPLTGGLKHIHDEGILKVSLLFLIVIWDLPDKLFGNEMQQAVDQSHPTMTLALHRTLIYWAAR